MPVQPDINQFRAMGTMLWAPAEFFKPRIPAADLHAGGQPGNLAFYDISPLKRCSMRLVDFDRINAKRGDPLQRRRHNIKTGNLTYFDNMTHKVGPAHVMASGSLPPGFPAHRGRRRVLLGRRHPLKHAAAMGARARPREDTLASRSICGARAASYRAT